MTKIFIFLGVVLVFLILFVLWACVHVDKVNGKPKKWWEDDAWH